MQEFWGKADKARGLYEEGQAKHGGTSRFYRSWAQFEKKQGRLEVSLQRLPLCQNSVSA